MFDSDGNSTVTRQEPQEALTLLTDSIPDKLKFLFRVYSVGFCKEEGPSGAGADSVGGAKGHGPSG